MDKTRRVPVSYRLFNPNYFHLRDAMRNTDIRFIFLKGGSSSGKSVSVAQAITLDTVRSAESTLVIRKVGASIQNSIYEDFKSEISRFQLDKCFNIVKNSIRCINGARIDFSGLDDAEKIKGISGYKRVILEELTEFDLADFKQIRKRLRGKEGQQIIAMFNPISEKHWIKEEIFDVEELHEVDNHLYGKVKNAITRDILPIEYSTVKKKLVNSSKAIYNPRTGGYDEHPPDMVIIESTYLNNFWVVGSPDGGYGYYDRQTIADFEKDKERDYDYYRIYALGDWGSIKTGGEFWWAFDNTRHKTTKGYDKTLPIHVSIDNNVLPYISISLWQTSFDGFVHDDVQIHEIAACDPHNTVTQAAGLLVQWLHGIGYTDVVYLYGDASTKANNTIDEEKRSFFDKFKEKIEDNFVVVDRIPRNNPSVLMSGEFINAIYSGDIPNIRISIHDSCLVSLEDYIMTKKDANGSVLKKRIRDKTTGQSYEEFGHFSDTKRYIITELHKDAYTSFSLRRKHNKTKEDKIRYYDILPAGGRVIVEINVNTNNVFTAVKALINGDDIFICDILFGAIPDIEVLCEFIKDVESVNMELPIKYKYYLFDLRDKSEMRIFGKKECSDKTRRISAHLDYISGFKFPANFDKNECFAKFIENYLDYNEINNIEAANILAQFSETVRKEYK